MDDVVISLVWTRSKECFRRELLNLRLCWGRSALRSFTCNEINADILIRSNAFELFKKLATSGHFLTETVSEQQACCCFFTFTLYKENVEYQESRVSDERSTCCTWPMLALKPAAVWTAHKIDTYLLQHPSSVSCLCSKFALFSVSTARGLDRLRCCSSSAVCLNK